MCKVVLGRGREGTGQPRVLSHMNNRLQRSREGGPGRGKLEARFLRTEVRGVLGYHHGAHYSVR